MARPLQIGDFGRIDYLSEDVNPRFGIYLIDTIMPQEQSSVITFKNILDHTDLRYFTYDSEGIRGDNTDQINEISFGRDIDSLKNLQAPLNYYDRVSMLENILKIPSVAQNIPAEMLIMALVPSGNSDMVSNRIKRLAGQEDNKSYKFIGSNIINFSLADDLHDNVDKLPGGVNTIDSLVTNTISSQNINYKFGEICDLMINDIIPNRKHIPEEIMQKAIAHAKKRHRPKA